MAATLSDIAREAGVARSTAADILRGRAGYSPDTRSRVMDTARKLNFVPNYFARSLQRRRSHTVGVIGNLSLAGVTGATLKAISDGLLAKGYMPLFCEGGLGHEGSERALTELRGRFVDGVILESDSAAETVERILPPGTPYVMIRNAPSSGGPVVCADRRTAFDQGVQWLFDRGHRRIAFLGVSNAEAMRNPYNSHALKIAGYLDGMRRLGIEDPSLLLDHGTEPGDTRDFVLNNPGLFRGITAILACNDRAALEAITALTEIGVRVPEDCSVIGFDDTDFVMASRPRLTSFNPRRAEVGRRAVEMVLNLIEGETVESITLVPELIHRESAGPCRPK